MTIKELQAYLTIAAAESKMGENAPVEFWTDTDRPNFILDSGYVGKVSASNSLNWYGELILLLNTKQIPLQND